VKRPRTARLESLRARFSHTTLPKLEKLYATAHHLLPPLLLLASLADDPERYGFVTHDETQRNRLEQLRARREQIGPLLFWRTLAVALRFNPFVFGSVWQLAIGAVVAFIPIATLFPGPVGLIAGLIPGSLFAAPLLRRQPNASPRRKPPLPGASAVALVRLGPRAERRGRRDRSRDGRTFPS